MTLTNDVCVFVFENYEYIRTATAEKPTPKPITEVFAETDTENRPTQKNHRKKYRKPTPTSITDTDPALVCRLCQQN
jgi:hypothetical protein